MSCSVYKWGLAGDRNFFFPQEFRLFHEFGLFFSSSMKFVKSMSSMFCDRCSETGYTVGFQAVRKKIVCFAYSLVVVFPLLFY